MFGYGGNNYERKIQDNEKGAFIIAESEMCTKYETEVEFGQIPRIFYYWIISNEDTVPKSFADLTHADETLQRPQHRLEEYFLSQLLNARNRS